MGKDKHENGEFSGAGFDQLRSYLGATAANSPQALAALDIADKYEIGAVMMAGGGIASRLAGDLRNSPGGNFSSRTGAMFGSENQNRRKANEVTDRIMSRRAKNPTYAEAIGFLTTSVIRSIDRASNEAASIKMDRISEGFKAIVAEVCTKPKKLHKR